ncbi:MAG: hypothetical protein HY282_11835 [Nitrospirae bacterium]|nr:hypothetical protein [Candidatus Manganitrophaceae bacterium]
MRINRLLTLGAMGVFLLSGAAFAQNIQTNTTSTTVGSTTFGFAITAPQLATVMQSEIAPTCGARGADGVMTCTLTNYIKAVGMPGSFTGNPFKIVWTRADFGCGFLCGTEGGPDPQTAPAFAGTTLTGNITSTIDLGLGTTATDPFHSAGHITFSMNPATMNAHIDQQVIQAINNATGLTMSFTETDATPTAGFTASNDPAILAFAGPVNLTAHMLLTQTGEQGAPSATPFTSDVTVAFPYGASWNSFPAAGESPLTGSNFPPQGAFTTPGLRTQVDNPATLTIDEGSLFPVFF